MLLDDSETCFDVFRLNRQKTKHQVTACFRYTPRRTDTPGSGDMRGTGDGGYGGNQDGRERMRQGEGKIDGGREKERGGSE